MIIDNYAEVNKTDNGVFPHMYRKSDEKLYKEFMSKASPETLETIIQKYQEYCKHNDPNHQIILQFAQKGANPNDETLAVWYDKEREALIKNGIEFVDVIFHLVADSKEENNIHVTIVCRAPVKEMEGQVRDSDDDSVKNDNDERDDR